MTRYVEMNVTEVGTVTPEYTSRNGFGLDPGKFTVEIRAPGCVVRFTGTIAEIQVFKARLVRAMETEAWKGGSR